MNTIYKYEIGIMDYQTIKIPCDSKILAFQQMNDKYFIWVLVDANKPLENRKFIVYGTGYIIKNLEKLNYIGTAHDENFYVWHLFEKLDKEYNSEE